jgi:hypothetical protein
LAIGLSENNGDEPQEDDAAAVGGPAGVPIGVPSVGVASAGVASAATPAIFGLTSPPLLGGQGFQTPKPRQLGQKKRKVSPVDITPSPVDPALNSMLQLF